LTRVSLLIGIFKALNILFQKRLANQWVSRPNTNPLFQDAAPIEADEAGRGSGDAGGAGAAGWAEGWQVGVEQLKTPFCTGR